MKFAELPEKAKEKLREKERQCIDDDEWWDCVYEDAVRCGSILGIEIGTRGTKVPQPAIYFSGFWSQGDGASFTGRYALAENALARIKSETDDEKLIKLAERLTVLQVAAKLSGYELRAKITLDRSNYSHSSTMDVDIVVDGNDLGSEDEYADQETVDEMTSIMRDFADWIYKQLEQEYDYQTSDEAIDEQLAHRDEDYDEEEIEEEEFSP